MAAKCDITRLALEKLSKVYWGLECKNNDCQVIDHYISYLNCPDIVHLQPQGTAGCTDTVVVFNCNVNILRTSLTVNQSVLNFTFNAGDIVGGKEPFQYKWFFDEEDFILSSPINEKTLVLTLRPGKSLLALVSKITMQITDAEGCFDEKVCYLVNGQMTCYNNYVACPNVNNLTIKSKFTQCAGPSALLVKRKI